MLVPREFFVVGCESEGNIHLCYIVGGGPEIYNTSGEAWKEAIRKTHGDGLHEYKVYRIKPEEVRHPFQGERVSGDTIASAI